MLAYRLKITMSQLDIKDTQLCKIIFARCRRANPAPRPAHPNISDVPARLGLKAGALAWPETALAFKIVKPSREPKPGQSRGLALA
jgi:hypothetical protein